MKIVLKVENRSKSQHRELAVMSQENKRSKNEGWLKQNLAAYNDLLTAYRLAYPNMDYKDIARCRTVLNQVMDELQAPIGDDGNKNE